MKRNNSLFPPALLVLALAIAPLPNAPAQEPGPAENPDNPSQAKAADLDDTLSEALKAVQAGATLSSFEKARSAGTNDVYTVHFTVSGTKMLAEVTGDGSVLKTEEPGDIAKFPEAANAAVRKAITGMGVKDNGVILTRTYAEIEEKGPGAFVVVKLSAPQTTYGANVQNNHGQPGKFRFTADGTAVERPTWAQ